MAWVLYSQRADTENGLEELKNQWGFRGYCSRRAVVTKLAARLALLAHNLWRRFSRLPGVADIIGVITLCRQRSFYVPVIWRKASWKDRPSTWTWKSMAFPARLRSSQRQ